MNTTSTVAIIAVAVIIGGGLYYNFMTPAGEVMMAKGDEMMDKGQAMVDKGDTMVKEGDTMMKEGEAMMAGQYIPYAADKLALAETGKVVLFFRASWCPTCKAVDADIKAHLKDIPKDVTILDVNYDDSTALKQKYGVTHQHTFVQVDAKGNLITKWSASPTLAAIVTNIK